MTPKSISINDLFEGLYIAIEKQYAFRTKPHGTPQDRFHPVDSLSLTAII